MMVTMTNQSWVGREVRVESVDLGESGKSLTVIKICCIKLSKN